MHILSKLNIFSNLRIAALTGILLTVVAAYGASPVTGPMSGQAPDGLDNRVIALWPSHGNYYNNEKGEWIWQRAHLLQTIEDLFSSSYVVDLLAPMLENAGAYVMMPRERDTNLTEIIIDADSPATPGYAETSGAMKWTDSPRGYAYTSDTIPEGLNPMEQGKSRMVRTTENASTESTASWSAVIPKDGVYNIYVSHPSTSESSTAAKYTVSSLRGDETFTVDQTMGGGVWMRLGEFPLKASDSPQTIVRLSNTATGKNIGKTIGADAVRIGGGMGNVSREGTVSGRPRWAEASRYYLQYCGFPESVYACSDTPKDYSDDFGSRPRWVNYLAGGSARAPREKGLNIPVDLSIALHTDAGITPDSTTIGTLGIYSSDGGSRLGDGRRRTTCRALTEAVVNSIVDDISALYDSDWTKRKIRDRKYAEARIPLVPSTLIESLSHQNFADMRLAQDPRFRFDLARAIYKGIARYLAPKGKKPTIQPLPVRSMRIDHDGAESYILSWQPTADPLEPSAAPASYIVEQRLPGGTFLPVKETSSCEYSFTTEQGVPTDFRVIASNSGGRSMPSEVLSVCSFNNSNPEVLIVNGFTRLSAPESFDTVEEAGFLDEIDRGVPYVRNIGYSGSQTDFERESPWIDDIEHPGFGASNSNYDCIPIAGNTFDYPAVHGRAIAAAKFSYISTSLEAYTDPENRFDAPIVDVILGKQREITPLQAGQPTEFKVFPAELQQRLKAHKRNGGSLMVSGTLVGTDIFLNPHSNDSTLQADIDFASDILNLEIERQFAAESGALTLLPLWSNSYTTRSTSFSIKPNEQCYATDSPDAISSSFAGAIPLLRFANSNFGAGYIAPFGDNATAVLSVPFEAILDANARSSLMKSMLLILSTVRLPMSEDSRPSIIPYGTLYPVEQPLTNVNQYNLISE